MLVDQREQRMSRTMALQCITGVCREEGAFDKGALIEEDYCPSLQLSGSGRFRKSL